MDSLGLQGYVPASARGTVSGTYSGTISGPAVTIGFKVSRIESPVTAQEPNKRVLELCSAILGVWKRVGLSCSLHNHPINERSIYSTAEASVVT